MHARAGTQITKMEGGSSQQRSSKATTDMDDVHYQLNFKLQPGRQGAHYQLPQPSEAYLPTNESPRIQESNVEETALSQQQTFESHEVNGVDVSQISSTNPMSPMLAHHF